MTKKILGIILCLLSFFCINSTPAYAKEYNIDGIRVEIEENSILLPEGVEHAADEVHEPKRGSVISTAFTSVDNDGNGDMTFSINTYAHIPCDEIRHKAFVDIWDDATSDWYTIETVQFVARQEMTPDKPLLDLINSFTIKKLEVGRYYRISGAHIVKLNGGTEALSSSTDGIKNEIH